MFYNPEFQPLCSEDVKQHLKKVTDYIEKLCLIHVMLKHLFWFLL